MTKKIILSVLLCLVLLLSLIGCKEKDTTTTVTPTTKPNTTTNSTTASTTVKEVPTKSVKDWLIHSMEQGEIYQFTVEQEENALSFYVAKTQNQWTLAYALGQENLLYYTESHTSEEIHIYLEGADMGLRFNHGGALTLRAQMEHWLAAILPDVNFTQNADFKAEQTEFTFENTTTAGTAILLPNGESYVLQSVNARHPQSGKSLTISLQSGLVLSDVPKTETLSNEYAPVLSKLLFLDAGYVAAEGNGMLQAEGQPTYLLNMQNSGKAPTLAGGKIQISANLSSEDNSKTAKLFYGEVAGVTVLQLGDVLVSMPSEQLPIFTEELLMLIFAYIAENDGSFSPEFSNLPTPLSQGMTPEASNQPTSPDGVYADEEGNVHFYITIPDSGVFAGTMTPTAEGLSFTLRQWEFAVEGQIFTLSGNYTLSSAESLPEGKVEEAPVMLDLEGIRQLAETLKQMGEYPYYQIDGKMALTFTLPLLGDVALDDISYSLLTDGELFSLWLSIKYPALVYDQLMVKPELPLAAVGISTACESRLYSDGANLYITTTVSTKYLQGLSLKTATATSSVKLPLAEALDNIDTVLSYALNLDMSQSLVPDVPSVPDIPSIPNPNPPSEEEHSFALSLGKGEEENSYLLKVDVAGVKALAEKWNLPIEISEDMANILITVSITVDEQGICQVSLNLTLEGGITISLSGFITYPETLSAPIVPQNIADDPAYAWLVIETE